jgi:hypothetical protein
MSEIAQYGMYFRSTSQKADMGASVTAVGTAGLRVNRRVFHMSAMAFTSFRELRADGDAEVRHALGIKVEIEATSTVASIQGSLGAVAAQITAEGVAGTCTISAIGQGEFVHAVNAKLPPVGPFDSETQASLQAIVNKILPDAIAPVPPAAPVENLAFGNFESKLEEYPEVAQLVVFACEQIAFGKGFKEAYLQAKKRFKRKVDPRPLEYVFQALGCKDLSSSTPSDVVDKAFRWIDDVDDYVTDLMKETNG